MEVLIGLELNPFEEDEVSSSCCVIMTVLFVDRRGEHQERWLLRRAIKKWPTFSSSTKVCYLSLVLFTLLLPNSLLCQQARSRQRSWLRRLGRVQTNPAALRLSPHLHRLHFCFHKRGRCARHAGASWKGNQSDVETF